MNTPSPSSRPDPSPEAGAVSDPGSQPSGSRSRAGTFSRTGTRVIVVLVVLLLVLHQDNWFWDDGRLVLGILPIGLFWHVLISIGATLTWALATKVAWPLDDFASGEAVPSDAVPGDAMPKGGR